jgi:peptidoglycan/xylan/chitin deacetylase (PgdA/CDA1 family)
MYAVPGALLEQGAPVYRRLAEGGAEFLNHGGASHTYYDETLGRHRSCFFYDEIGPDAVRRDIEDGQRIVESVLGVAPLGFRTPHFGTFQRPEDLLFLHGVLRDVGVRYSSSTTPLFGYRYGPVFDRFGLPEVPVTGMASAPLDILDTWGCFRAPDRTRTPDDYRAEGTAVADRLATAGAGLLNVYGDPSHVHDHEEFFATVERWLQVAEPVDLRTVVGGWR